MTLLQKREKICRIFSDDLNSDAVAGKVKKVDAERLDEECKLVAQNMEEIINAAIQCGFKYAMLDFKGVSTAARMILVAELFSRFGDDLEANTAFDQYYPVVPKKIDKNMCKYQIVLRRHLL